MTQRATNYAKALYDLNISEEVVQNTKNIILESNELFNALSNPSIKNKEKHTVIDSIFEKEIRNFLKILCDNNCVELVLNIFNIYADIVLENKNTIKATLTYVTKVDDEQIENIKEFIRNKYDKSSVLLELKEDVSLIGGFILSVGDTDYDKSIKGTLSSLHKVLVWR